MKDRLIRFLLDYPEPLYDLLCEYFGGKREATISMHIRHFLLTGRVLRRHAE